MVYLLKDVVEIEAARSEVKLIDELLGLDVEVMKFMEGKRK